MKKHPSQLLPLVALTALTLVGCPETTARDKAEAPAREAQIPSAPGESETDKLKAYAFAQRTEFATQVRAAAAKLDAQIATLAPGKDAPADAAAASPRDRALDEIKSARAILDERIGRIDQAVSENWESVRNEVLVALSQTQGAYERAAKV